MEEIASWHLLDASGIATREFGAALNRIVPTICWQPDYRWFPIYHATDGTQIVVDPPLELRRFRLQHGYSHPSIGWLSRFAERTVSALRHFSRQTPLICTAPFYAPVARKWDGPVIYYLTDFAAAYDTLDSRQVASLDQSLSRVAAVLCPNSRRLADYLIERAGCDPAKIVILPNATRRSSIRENDWHTVAEAPADLRDLPRPLIGIMGNLAGNLDWELIDKAIFQTPSTSWVFVGPASMEIASSGQREARARVLSHARVRFLGPKPYGVLHQYARAFDAAVLPYLKHEPTFSGSSTRFYEHLAACRPMLATRGVEELTRKKPLLHLVDSAEELARELVNLQRCGFHDGFEESRWLASRWETWDCRAEAMVKAVECLRLGPSTDSKPRARRHVPVGDTMGPRVSPRG